MTDKLKLLVLAFMLSLWAGTASGQSTGNVLRLSANNGKQYHFYLSDNPEVTFAGEYITIESKTMYVSIPRSTVKDFRFLDASGIREIEENRHLEVHRGMNVITVSGITAADKPIQVFDMSGKPVSADISLNGDSATISLESLSRGVYIIKIGKQETFKVTKK